MNTWIISPNWLAWGLLIIATIALCLIALFLQRMNTNHRAASNNQQPQRSSAWHIWERAMAWLAFVLSIITIAYLSLSGNINAASDFSTTATVLGILVTLLVTWNIYQVIDTKRSMEDVTVLRTEFNNIRRELDTLHQMHEAYVLASVGEDNRVQGRSTMAFEYFIRSAFIFTRDLEHYTLRFMSSISSMDTAFDDLMRPAMGDRQPEIAQFINRRDRFISELERLREQTNGLIHSAEQARHELTTLIGKLRNLQLPQEPSNDSNNAQIPTEQ